MNREERRHFDVLVIGGGPAGMAAAACAAECGVRVGIVDDNFQLGGQIWRGGSGDRQNTEASNWVQRLRTSGATVLGGLRVVHQPEAGVLLAENLDRFFELRYEKLVLATGARERFLPFPGWTLPNVMGAGGLQAMVKSGLPIQGKRVIVAGTGPLLLAVADYLRKHGAEIPVICEQASWRNLAQFGIALANWPAKMVQGVRLKLDLSGVPLAANSWPLAAHGQKTLERVTISRAGRVEDIPCDYLACARLWISFGSEY
jgi:NADPH-dependent 2,4-dienoyl-CoA reductase/sulfur reductase-like enzyme